MRGQIKRQIQMKHACRAALLLLFGRSAGDDSDSAVVRPGASGGQLTEGGGSDDTPSMAPRTGAPTPGQFGPNEEVASSIDENNCGLQYFDVQRRPAEVLLVLDRSGSMRE